MANKSNIVDEGGEAPLLKALVGQLLAAKVQPAEVARKMRDSNFVIAIDPYVQASIDEEQRTGGPLAKSISNLWPRGSVERIAFEADPGQTNQYAQLYKMKMRLVPDTILKRVLNTDDLVAAIVMTRQGQISWFGRPREERHDNGYVIEPKKGVLDRCSEEQQKVLQDRIEKATELLKTCGHTEGWAPHQRMGLTDFLKIQVRYALGVGRITTEAIYVDGVDGEKHFHSFRPIDAGTIYRAAPQKAAAEAVREQARILLERIKNKKLLPEKYQNDEYAWVQVLDGRPVQAFTSKECLVKNFYPCADVELDGYPVTPIDTMLSAVMTHINIVTHNKLYFQHGRASRGMLVIKSHDVNDDVVNRIRQQFNASINSVNNAWRMPVFGITPEDDLQWQAIDQGQRDAEFQYLTDMNARVILSAFQMSPEELPGWTYLSRGTNNQALSESNNEYRLEAHRDLGIRPLIKQFEDFLNESILPLIDPNLSKLCRVRLLGLDADTEEKEAVRLQQDAQLHMTQNDIMEKVEKDPIPKELGGDVLLSPAWQAIVDKYVPVGVVLEKLLGIKGASQDPQWAYVRDPFWFNWQQLQLQAAQPQGGGGGGGDAPPGDGAAPDGGGDGGGGDAPPDQSAESAGEGQTPPSGGEGSAGGSADASASAPQDLTRSLNQAITLLSKSEKQLPASKRRLLAQHRKTVEQLMKGFEEDAGEAVREILKAAGLGQG